MYKKRNCAGVVTVFLIIVFFALLLLTGVIIDTVRIMVAENKVSHALSTAARSVLAGYDADLAGEFGIYAFQTGKQTDARRYFEANLQERHQNYQLVNYTVVDFQIDGKVSVLQKETYENQIIQYMKYKAPEAIAEKLAGSVIGSKLGKKTELLKEGGEAAEKRVRVEGVIEQINKKVLSTAIGSLQVFAKDSIEDLRQLKNTLQVELEQGVGEYLEALAKTNQIAEELGEGGTFSDQGDINEIRQYIRDQCEKIDKNIIILIKVKELQEQLKQLDIHDTEFSKESSRLYQEISRLRSQLQNLETLDLASMKDSKKTVLLNFAQRFTELQTRLKSGLLGEKIHEKDLISPKDIRQGNEVVPGKTEPSYADYEKGGELKTEKEGGKLIKYLQEFTGMLEALAVSVRNDAYVVEYILDKHTFVTSGTLRDHYLNKGEIEYILHGCSEEAVNLALVCGDIFLLRFALNTLDFFIRSTIIQPLARLAWALGEGFVKAGVEIVQLYSAKKVPLIPGSIIESSYADHLRLLLLLENKNTRFERMQQLVQINLRNMKGEEKKDFLLRDCYTSLQAKAAVDVNLLFIPLLSLDKLGFDQFSGGKYRIEKELYVGY